MLKLFFFFVKLTLFIGAVVLLSSWLSWDGRSLSAHVKDGLARLESVSPIAQVESWLGMTREDAKHGARKAAHHVHAHAPNSGVHHATGNVAGGANGNPTGMADTLVTENSAEHAHPAQERVSPTERQKLRALIQELNSTSRPTAKN